MKTVNVKQLSALRMVASGERQHPKVIHEGKVKQWIGFGWVTERDVELPDYDELPVAIYDDGSEA